MIIIIIIIAITVKIIIIIIIKIIIKLKKLLGGTEDKQVVSRDEVLKKIE